MQYPETVRIVRVPCSGRADPMFVLKGFQKGFDGVMVLGCHPGDCHYAKGNYYARRRIALTQDLLKIARDPAGEVPFRVGVGVGGQPILRADQGVHRAGQGARAVRGSCTSSLVTRY